jgi:hypothetical protein
MEPLSDEVLAELEVLSSIFEPETFFGPQQASRACRLVVAVEVPDSGVCVCVPAPDLISDDTSAPPSAPGLLKRGSSSESTGDSSMPPRTRLVALAALPPIELYVSFPHGYPESHPPVAALTAPWLSSAASHALCTALATQWTPGEPCVFQWYGWLRGEALPFLLSAVGTGIAADVPLSSAAARLLSHASEAEVRLPLYSSPAETIAAALRENRSAASTRCLVLSVRLPPSATYVSTAGAASSAAEAGLHTSPQPSDGGGSTRLSSLVSLATALEYLLLFDLTFRRHRWAASQYSCPVCLDDHPGADCLALSGCGHAFCRACLREHVRGCLRSGLRVEAPAAAAATAGSAAAEPGSARLGISCPDISCGELMAHHDIRACLVPAFAEEFAR